MNGALFSERVEQENQQKVHRCYIYRLLTDRPNKRINLDWEKGRINNLLKDGITFICPWTEKRITNRYRIRPRPFVTFVPLPHQRTVESCSG